MPSVRVAHTIEGSVHEAETCWYDTGRWSAWMDGLERVERVRGPWPDVTGTVTWESVPPGRGRVTETVTAYAPLEGQTVRSDEAEITLERAVAFSPHNGHVEVAVTLSWRYKRRTPSVVLGSLFIRGAFARSLQATLERFAHELEAARRGDVG